jgi:hypothetical protein
MLVRMCVCVCVCVCRSVGLWGGGVSYTYTYDGLQNSCDCRGGGFYNYLVKARELCPRYSDGSVVGTRQQTPRFSLVLEKLLVPSLIKTFHAFGGIRMFMVVFTRVRHLSVSRGI